MSDQEIIAFLFLMVVAGNETTTKLLGNAMFHLTQHPEQRDDVFTGDDDLVDRWIEETLRHDTSTQLLARHLIEDLTLHGVTAPRGSKLLFCLGAANRDERVFTDPDTFDVHRDEAELRQLLSFGGGRHFCLGAHLARLEIRVALEELYRRFPNLAVVGEPQRAAMRQINSIKSLVCSAS
jgi:cytochrome P450